MFDSLSCALARSIDVPAVRPANKLQANAGVSAVKPVLQLAELPITINPDLYRDAFSSTNSNGDRRAARAFRDLVDPVPPFERGYVPTIWSLESIYGSVVNGAQVLENGSFVQSLFAQAQLSFNSAAQASLDGTPGNVWRLVDAIPSDWWDASAPDRFKQVDMDIGGDGSGDFTILGGTQELKLGVGDKTATLDPATKLKALSFKYQTVTLKRGWCNPTLFSLGGWDLVGAPVGFCSSGRTDANVGVLPLMPSCILVGCDATVDADWAPADAKVLDEAGGQPTSLGPFPLGAAASQPGALFLAAVISTLVPFSPQVS